MANFTTSGVYDHAMGNFGQGLIHWVSAVTDIWCLLCDNTASTKATHSLYSDVKATQIANGNGYTTGGKYIAPVTANHNGGGTTVVQFDSADTVWAGMTNTSYGARLCHGTTIDQDANLLISFHTFGGAQAVVAGTLTLDWAATGCFTITVGAES
jgi:hypothetical protein